MNLKYFKQRASHSETPIKRSQNSIQLSQFFSRPSHQISNLKHLNIDYLQKQNHDPNLEIYHRNKNAKQSSNQVTPKRKVIHLKSVSRNSKSKKYQNSQSMSKKYNDDNIFTEVADFTDTNANNSKHGIIIQIDLKKHRRSIQDTLTSSVAQNQFLIRSQFHTCSQHIEKKATFQVKGKLYCDKCAAKLITKGFVAVKVDKEIMNQTQQQHEEDNYQVELNSKQKRNKQLQQFIQSLDKIDPILQSIGSKLQSYSYWLGEYYDYQVSNLDNNWKKMLSLLQNLKKQLDKNLKVQKQKADQMMQEARIKVREETENLKFMRNDIIRNIDKIIDEKTIHDQNFVKVMNIFKEQLEQISQNTLKIQRHNLNVPKVEFDLFKFDQQIRRYIFVRPISQQLFSKDGFNTPSERSSQEFYGEDPYRMSFGKQMQKVQSPTFKVL